MQPATHAAPAAPARQEAPAPTNAQLRAQARAEEGPAVAPTRNTFRLGLAGVAHILLFHFAQRSWSCSECGALMWEQELTGDW
jgi:hypothetical protein